MWPSFSLCACRILKIRSCLRRPLAPGRSSERAMRVSSVMFFSFSSAIVMFTYVGIFKRGVIREAKRRSERAAGEFKQLPAAAPRQRLHARLRPPACPSLQSDAGLRLSFPGFGYRLVELTRCLGSKLAKHITILHVMYSVKYQIRAHCVFPFPFMKLAAVLKLSGRTTTPSLQP